MFVKYHFEVFLLTQIWQFTKKKTFLFENIETGNTQKYQGRGNKFEKIILNQKKNITIFKLMTTPRCLCD